MTWKVFDELGYVAIPPCLWGPKDEGLIPPSFLSFDTNLLSIKRNNNTYGRIKQMITRNLFGNFAPFSGHYGEMAMWQMRGVLVEN